MQRIPQEEVDKFQKAGKMYQVMLKTENGVESVIDEPYPDRDGAEACKSFIENHAKKNNPERTLSFYIKEI